jgi:pimeloyl-ACP methyl ester carboxylesterase
MGQGEAVICVHGVPASGFLYRKLLPELASRGLEGVTLDLPGLGLAGRPADFDYSWSGLATWYLKAIDAAGIRNFHLVVHDIGGLSVLTSSGAFPIELSRSQFSIRSST